MYVKYCIQLLKGRTPKCNPCAPQIWISSCYGLNVCVLPKFLCGNHNPHGDDIRRQGVWEVIKSSRWSHHDWNHSFHKRSPIDISCTFHLGKTYARRQKSVNQQVSPLSVSTLISDFSAIRAVRNNCVAYKPPSLWHFVLIAQMN